jgi:branched-chain amino acid transport system permease protein
MLELVVAATLLGGVYALFAAGLTISLGVMRVFNVAYGAVLTLVTIAVIDINARVALPFVALVLLAVVLGGILGALVELIAVTPLSRTWRAADERSEATFISTLAVLLILQSVALNVTNAQLVRFPANVLPSATYVVAGIHIRGDFFLPAGIGVLLIVIAWVIMRWTQTGRCLRAIAADPHMASLLGINVPLYSFGSAVAAGSLAGLAGVLLAALFPAVDFLFGDQFLLRGFVIVILGGLGSIPGVLVGAVVLSIAEGLVAYFGGSGWRLLASGAVVVLILLFRPQGIFGRREVDRS